MRSLTRGRIAVGPTEVTFMIDKLELVRGVRVLQCAADGPKIIDDADAMDLIALKRHQSPTDGQIRGQEAPPELSRPGSFPHTTKLE